MTKKPTAPADAASVADAAALVAQLKADIAALEIEIATAESERDAKALELKDEEFEALVLKNERTKRSLLRLHKQLDAASEALEVAKAGEEQDRRKALYEAGQKAESEVERLVAEYGKRAASVAETLHDINKHAEVIRVANENRPDYTPWSDPYGTPHL